jgi:hypothetical protein
MSVYLPAPRQVLHVSPNATPDPLHIRHPMNQPVYSQTKHHRRALELHFSQLAIPNRLFARHPLEKSWRINNELNVRKYGVFVGL